MEDEELRDRVRNLERQVRKFSTLPYTILFLVVVLIVVSLEQYSINAHLKQQIQNLQHTRTEVIRVEAK